MKSFPSREAYNDYMREYMRRYRASGRYVRNAGERRAPLKTPPLVSYENLTAAICGDPPIGRRALDAMQLNHGHRPEGERS